MRIPLRSIVCILFLASGLAAHPWQVDSTKISQAVQDSTGQVWGIALYAGLGLYRWEGDGWRPVVVAVGLASSLPLALARGPDGAAYCVWSAGTDTLAVTWHKGASSKLVARFTGHLADRPRIFLDPNGNTWITEPGRHIFRVSTQGEAESAYTIADNQFHEDGRPQNEQSGFNPISAIADARGRIWFWSDCLAGGTNIASLQGVLISSGGKFEHHPHISGMPDKKISIVAPDDAEHMWVAMADDQLYRVDISTLTATPVPGPSPQVFRYVQRIFTAGRKTFLVSGPTWQPVPELSGGGRSGVLWLLSDGRWEKLVNGLDMRPEYFQQSFRPFSSTMRGLWIGAFGVGPWFIPAEQGNPKLVDWHYDYPLDGSEAVFQLADGRLLIVSANQGSIAVKEADLLEAFQSPPEVSTINPPRPFIQDVRGHILGILATAGNVLSDWDGKTWTDHPLPAGFDPAHFGTFTEDSLNRVWLFPDPWGKSVAIFGPGHQTFEYFADYHQALQAQLPNREGFHLEANLFMVPSFTHDGRICYRDEWCRVHYFDGRKWLCWGRKEIDGSDSVVFDGPPFFDKAGNVGVNIEEKTWEFAEAKGWHTTNFEHGLGTDRERQAQSSPAAPAGCDISSPESIARDRLGTYWLTYRGQLYRAIPGLCLPQFSPQEHQPFIDSRKVAKVLIDPRGNAFLETLFYFNPLMGEYAILKARSPLPHTLLRATVGPSGEVRLRFDADSKRNVRFIWRVDEGPWAAPTKKPDATLDWLPNGKHMIEAAAIDERLQIDPTPAVAQVEIHVDPREQISALIGKLGDPDYSARNDAVAGLQRQPSVALPLLRSAREKASPDQRWWIDAAIQQIEESISTNKKP
jgi:streptogramin lyase